MEPRIFFLSYIKNEAFDVCTKRLGKLKIMVFSIIRLCTNR